MGCKSSKEEDEFADTYDTRRIYYDDDGNLRYGNNMDKDRDEEKNKFMNPQVDNVDEVDGKEWYVIDSAWIASWLAYVHFDKDVSPAPGPIRNDRLLVENWTNYEKPYWEPKKDLVMAVKNKAGDYRRVSEIAWNQFCDIYKTSGPAIKMTFKEDPAHKEDGKYDTSSWVIDQTKFNFDDADELKRKREKAKAAAKLRDQSLKEGVKLNVTKNNSATSPVGSALLDSMEEKTLSLNQTDAGNKSSAVAGGKVDQVISEEGVALSNLKRGD